MTDAELKRERLAALRPFRAAMRQFDTRLEKVERKILALSNRKTTIRLEDAEPLVILYNDMVAQLNEVDRSLTDFLTVVKGVLYA